MNTRKIQITVIAGFMNILNPVVHASDWTGNITGSLGQKTLDEKSWPQLDKQAEFAVLIDVREKSWPISIAIDHLVPADVCEIGIQKM